MTHSMNFAQKIFEDYHRFDDGIIHSFEYMYPHTGKLCASMVFEARNQALEGDIWRRVRITVHDVKELRLSVKGNQFRTICAGVKLLQFDDLWCIDVDGIYAQNQDPTSLTEILEDGVCFVIGTDIEVVELIE